MAIAGILQALKRSDEIIDLKVLFNAAQKLLDHRYPGRFRIVLHDEEASRNGNYVYPEDVL
jgi:hypothetical protein